MGNWKCGFRQVFACVLTTGMVLGGVNFAAVPVSAEEQEVLSTAEKSRPASTESGADTAGKEDQTKPADKAGVVDQPDETLQAAANLIKELPTLDELKAQTEDEQKESYIKIQAAFDAFSRLTDEQKQQLKGADKTLIALDGYFSDKTAVVSEVKKDEEDAETDAALEGLMELGASFSVPKSLYGNFGSERLKGFEKDLYNCLKEEIVKIAKGERESAVFDVSSCVDTGDKAQELGTEGSAILDSVTSYLLMDCPYELYWFDKELGTDFSVSIEGSTVKATISFVVSEEYRKDKADLYSVNTSLISEANKVTQTALDIVDKYKDKSDQEKLIAYKDEICALVSYDDNAAEGKTDSLEAWQLISVFDNDESTNVVCEGYAKAFQCLCELSTFKEAKCYTVTGTMTGGIGAGLHMWNVVSIGGGNYLVDVTNCDSGSIGAPDKLFLATPADGTWEEGYAFNINGQKIVFRYDESTKKYVGESILKLAGEAYDPSRPSDNPGTPDTPEKPGDSDNSGTVETPDKPGDSENPGDSDKPGSAGNTGTTTRPGSTGGSGNIQGTTSKPATTNKPEFVDVSQNTGNAGTAGIYVESLDPSDQNQYMPVMEEAIKTTDELITNRPELTDAAKIESFMKDTLVQKTGILVSRIHVYEISLQVKDGNGNWVAVTKDNFPEKGIKITMPYPTGTGKRNQFFGQHLFTTSMNGFTAGQTEDLTVSNEENGISFVVHGLSPVSIGWNSSDKGTAGTVNAGQGAVKTAPKTGDNDFALFYVVLMLFAVGISGVYIKRVHFAER